MELEKTSAQYGCTCICNSEQKATAGKLSRAGKCLASSSWKLGMLSSAPSTGHRCRIACARSARVASPPCMQARDQRKKHSSSGKAAGSAARQGAGRRRSLWLHAVCPQAASGKRREGKKGNSNIFLFPTPARTVYKNGD